ncbi:MAG: 3-deoxy-D-manno-octulosonic acid transferase [Candidatus Aminicenantia bacterium]
MILLWNIFFGILLFFVSPYYLITRGNLRVIERTGKNLKFTEKRNKRVWFHAVSLGEVNLSIPIARELKKKGNYEILLTSTTPTGLEVGNKKLGNFCCIYPSPFDLIPFVRNYFESFEPDILILVEAEIWPTLLWEAKRRNIPVVLINARFGKRTEKIFRILRSLSRGLISKIDKILVQSEVTRNFLLDIGIEDEKIIFAGSLKAELVLPKLTDEEISIKKQALNLQGKKIFTAGSTLEGEEEILLKAFKKLGNDDLVLIIAPRHPERFVNVENLIKKYGFEYQKKSTFKKENFRILLLDTIGELPEIYAISDATFVGGSLVKKGGHNFLEPVFYRKPVFFGPFIDNFRELADIFVSNSGAGFVKDENDLFEIFSSIGGEEQIKMGEKGYEILCKLKGAKEKTLNEILSLLNS